MFQWTYKESTSSFPDIPVFLCQAHSLTPALAVLDTPERVGLKAPGEVTWLCKVGDKNEAQCHAEVFSMLSV